MESRHDMAGGGRSLPPPPSLPFDYPSDSAALPTLANKRRRVSASTLSGCCRTCRLRKVKCSGNPGNNEPCTNCARLELVCPFTVNTNTQPSDKIARTAPTHSHTEAGTVRKRAQRACNQCHSQKTKCSGDLPHCKRCETNGLSCEYTPAKRKFANLRFEKQPDENGASTKKSQSAAATAAPIMVTPSSTTAPSKADSSASPAPSQHATKSTGNFVLSIDVSILNAEELLLRRHIIIKHLDAYFEHLYWLPCMGFFHPTTAYNDVYEGKFDATTATALCAVSSFFVDPSEAGKEFSMKCCDQVEFFIFRNIHKFSEHVLMVYSLILSYDFLCGAFAKVWQCFGLAARAMAGLQINWDFNMRNKTFTEQETLRRIAWQFFVMDRLLAGGYEEYISCRAENMKIRLPCLELAYWENRPVIAERLREPSPKGKGIGLHGLSTRLVDLNHRIQVFTKKLAAKGSLEPSKVMEEINHFQSELSRFHSYIPDDIRLSDQSIAKYMPSSERAGYVFLHTHLSMGHIELYRYALPGIIDASKNNIVQKLPPDFVDSCKKQAVAHALCTARFCKAIQDEIEKVDNSDGRMKLAGDCTIPHMCTQSLRVLLIAMQYEIYDRLTEGTTAPLWRFEQPNEVYVRNIIDSGLFRVTEPWVPVLGMARQVHASHTRMVAEFDKTRKFSDQKGTLGFSGPRIPGRLPGPHFILEHANNGVVEQEKRTRAADAATADRWFRGGPQNLSHSNEPSSPYAPSESGIDTEYGPPGVPMILAVARTSHMGPFDHPHSTFAAEQQAMFMQQNIWLDTGLLPGPEIMSAEGVPIMDLDPNSVAAAAAAAAAAGAESMLFPPQGPPPAGGTYMPTQSSMFAMNGFGPQYAGQNGDQETYMQPPNFG